MKSRYQKKIGKVIKRSGEKTIKVSVEHRMSHPKYRKVVKSTTVYLVHDESESAEIGDNILFVSCRPLSAKKQHRLFKVLGDAQ